MKKMVLRLMLGCLCIGALFLAGCEDEKAKAQANQQLVQAQQDLQMLREMGANAYAKETYNFAELKYAEGKQHVDQKNYQLALRDWEDFQLLILRAKNEAVRTKEKLEQDKIAAAKAAVQEVERVRLAALDVAAKKELDVKLKAQAEAQAKVDAKLKADADAIAREESSRAQSLVAQKGLEAEQLAVLNQANTTGRVALPGGTWTVSRGDTLCGIARARYNGNYMKWKVVYRLNKKTIHNPNLIYPGQPVKLP